ncbi:MAG: hypothetical protein EAZ57_07370 [Cytophagales bacterium]|nr:MAG: hypothetical protein EAZ57_07370 [Cytophagales bacterium]
MIKTLHRLLVTFLTAHLLLGLGQLHAQKSQEALLVVDKVLLAYTKLKPFSANYSVLTEFSNIAQTGSDEGQITCVPHSNPNAYSAFLFEFASSRIPFKAIYNGLNLIQLDLNSKTALMYARQDSMSFNNTFGTLDYINLFRLQALGNSNIIKDLKTDVGGSLVMRAEETLEDGTACIVMHRVKKAGDKNIDQTFYLNKKTMLIHRLEERVCRFGMSCQTITVQLKNVNFKVNKHYFKQFKIPEDFVQKLIQ